MMAVSTGPQLPDDRQGHGSPEQAFGPELHQGVIPLQSEYHTGEKSDQGNDRHRLRPDEIHLLHQLGPLYGQTEQMTAGIQKKKEHPAQLLHQGQGRPTQAGYRSGEDFKNRWHVTPVRRFPGHKPLLCPV